LAAPALAASAYGPLAAPYAPLAGYPGYYWKSICSTKWKTKKL
jgi:hypothetical protein